jgi:hypothetical protein
MITPRTILMEAGTLHPECFRLEAEPFPNTWMSVTHDLNSYELEKALNTAGWTFFYMSTVVSTIAFGFNRANMIHAALKRLIAGVKQQKCNSLEIDDLETHSFLGVPYVSASAHPRHVQKGMVFSGQ